MNTANSVTVLLELEPSTEVIGSQEIDIGARVRWVHAAHQGAARTLCGLDPRGLEPERYRPSSPDQPWCPPAHHTRRCPACDTLLGETG
ncbi:hypothetical protein GCM10009665_70140 [Kitasatospora nipponensis]|uniref:Uncharacterized protein n=1 Tax=Kitasatospora nipponensis TaxID=258049 RepID=A0ABP4HKQ0_9ACTN